MIVNNIKQSDNCNFTSLKSISYETSNWVNKRMAIAFKDSHEFQAFCKKRDVFVKISTEKSDTEFEKPVINITCKKIKSKFFLPILTKTEKMTIKFIGDVKNQKHATPLDYHQNLTSNEDYLDTMCKAVLKIIKMSKENYETMLAKAKETKKPITIKLN